MKKFLSLFVALVMMASLFAVSSSAAMYVQSDFSSVEGYERDFHWGSFYMEEEGLVYGYNEAKCLQTKGEWFTFDTRIELSISDDTMATGTRAFTVSYPNTNMENYGRYEGSYFMNFSYSVDKNELSLRGGGVGSSEDNELLAGPVECTLSDDMMDFSTFGMSVERQRIRCFVNDKLIFDYYDEADQYLIGLEDENTVPTALVYWNDGNFIQVKDVKIASPKYIFPEVEVEDTTTSSTTVYENDPTGTTSTRETTTSISNVVVTNDKGEVETDDKGNQITETVIVTEATNAADTNTNKPVGGNSTATGDATFVVIAAMVAAIGSAVIVKKVSVR